MKEKEKQPLIRSRELVPKHGCRTNLVLKCLLLLVFGVILGIAVAIGVGWFQCEYRTASPLPPSPPPQSVVGRYRTAAVATDAAECSKIGTDMLTLHNGTAVDAAIAALICVGAANMHSAGIGGGSFGIVYESSSGEITGHDFRAVAPNAAKRDMFVSHAHETVRGPLSIAVPGDVAMYYALHKKYGRVKWADLWAPTIDLCGQGMRVGRDLARVAAEVIEKGEGLQYGLRELLHNPATNATIAQGDVIQLPKLKRTLDRIARNGAYNFYRGKLARDIVSDLNDVGSILTDADLSQFSGKHRHPLRSSVGGYDVYSLPPSSSGAVVQFILNIIRNYDFNPSSIATPAAKALTYHRIIEAMKFAYAKRSELGDPAFVNNTENIEAMMSPAYGEQIRALITNRTHNTSYYGAKFTTVDDHGTTHLSVVDKEGNAVGMTSTINLHFGSMVVGSRTGILFCNNMNDFSSPGTVNAYGVPPSKANFIEPGKRPQSSMSPVIVMGKDGVAKVLGAAGGTRIITSVVLTLIRTLLLGQDIQTAVDTPRFHHQLVPTTLGVEPTFPADVRVGLEARGHVIEEYPAEKANVHSVVRDEPYWLGTSDGRKGGAPDGY